MYFGQNLIVVERFAGRPNDPSINVKRRFCMRGTTTCGFFCNVGPNTRVVLYKGCGYYIFARHLIHKDNLTFFVYFPYIHTCIRYSLVYPNVKKKNIFI